MVRSRPGRQAVLAVAVLAERRPSWWPVAVSRRPRARRRATADRPGREAAGRHAAAGPAHRGRGRLRPGPAAPGLCPGSGGQPAAVTRISHRGARHAVRRGQRPDGGRRRAAAAPASLAARAGRRAGPAHRPLAGLHQLTVTNHLFEQSGIRPTQRVLDDLRTAYRAGMWSVNFGDEPATTNQINGVVNQETHGLVPALFPAPLPTSTRHRAVQHRLPQGALAAAVPGGQPGTVPYRWRAASSRCR